MIISPPFLPVRAAGQSEESWLDEAMRPTASRLPDTHAAEGSFPLSHNLCWHNGIHLQAPIDDGGNLPVRAIADGIVRFVNPPAPANLRVDDPQNYNPFQRAGTESNPAWTDNGCVIIEHTTSIGATGTAETQVTFYSLYTHLNELGRRTIPGETNRPYWAAGDRIWRKDVVGQAGRIYGHGGQIHFEICFDTTNLQRLLGRTPAWVDPASHAAPTSDGRSDAVYGSTYFFLPSSSPTHAGTLRLNAILGGTSGAAGELGTPLWVRMTYDDGGCTFESFDRLGTRLAALPGDAASEYGLYADSLARHEAVRPADRTLSSPSGWYELLRLGRNLGHGSGDADNDPLPVKAAHWRRIPNAAGAAVWADLNADGTFKFSDADFLPVMGWNCIDDDTNPGDQRCESPNLLSLILEPGDGNAAGMEPDQLIRRLGDPNVRARLRKTCCKFPSEWDKATIAERYQFVQKLQTFVEAPHEWQRLEAHLKALSFDGLPAKYLQADWHVQPRELIGQMRKCGWLSAREFAQCFPRKQLHLRGTSFHLVTKPWTEILPRADSWARAFNIENRRFGVARTRQRLVHYFSHVIPETGFLAMVKEGDNTAGTYLRGQPYWPYYGRGLIQLTWLDKYQEYGRFRAFPRTESAGTYAALGWNPDDLIAASNSSFNRGNCSDSACFFVVSKTGMLRAMDRGIATDDAVDVSRYVNGRVAIQNLNGLDIRLQSILFLRDVLLDRPADDLTESLTFTWRRSSEKEPTGRTNARGQPERAFVTRVWTIDVPLEKQRP